MYQRPQIHVLTSRLKEQRKFIQAIVGPRQVGKTTMVNQLLEKSGTPYHFVSADAVDATNHSWIQQQWETTRILIQSGDSDTYILAIDEIHKISNWSESVKAEWDKDTREKVNIKVILLGSSRLLLQKGLTESLAGRFETIYMTHWTFNEMHDAFGLNAAEYVWYGGYPGPAALIHDEKRWQDYVCNALIETTISKDILMMSRIDKPALLKRIFELGCLYSGQILSYNKMLGQLQDAGNTTTLSHYLDLLGAAGLLTGLEKYYVEEVRQRSSSPKFQVLNTALLSAQTETSFKEVVLRPEKWGRWVESAIGAHLINCSSSEALQVRYWRHRNDEVDFVLSYKGKLIGLEVKSGASHHASGMQAFQRRFNPHKLIPVGDEGLPWQEFLKINPLELF